MKENLDSLKDQERVTSLLMGRKVFGLMKRREFVDKTSTKASLKRRQKRRHNVAKTSTKRREKCLKRRKSCRC